MSSNGENLPAVTVAGLLKLADRDPDRYWQEITDLSCSDAEEARLLSIAWCSDPAPQVQGVGIDLLVALADGKDFSDSGDDLLQQCEALSGSLNEEVRWSVARAATRSHSPKFAGVAVRLSRDPAVEVRKYATSALSSCMGYGSDGQRVWSPNIVEALIERCEDESPEVRDWAIMGLGTQLQDFDTPHIRDVLFAHVDDPGGDIAGEAALGLALRHDARVIPLLLKELSEPDVGNLYVEAAASVGDRRLLPLLITLKADGWAQNESRPELLADAIDACSGRV